MKLQVRILVMAALVAFTFSHQEARAQGGASTFTRVASTGDVTPAGVTFAGFSAVASNDQGQFVVIAGGGTGLYLVSGGTVTPIAVSAGEIPGMAGVSYDELQCASINNHGQIAFGATVLGQQSGAKLLLWSSGTVRVLVSEGDRVPGPVFANFSDFLNVAVNDNGAVGFTGRFNFAETGAFLYSNGVVSAIAVPNQTAPGAGGGQFSAAACRSLTNSGVMLVQAGMRDGNTSSGIFLHRNGALQSLIQTGGLVPGGTNGETFFRFSSAQLLDEAGSVIFQGDGIANSGHFVLSGGSLQTVIFTTQPAPGTGGKQIADFYPITSNLHGDAAFVVRLANQQTVLYRYSNRVLTPVIISDQNVNGSFAKRFMPSGTVCTANNGAIAFLGNSGTPATTGVFSITGTAVSAVLTSQMPIPSSRLRLSTDVAINQKSSVAFTAVAAGNGKGLFLAQGPSITSMMLVGAAVPGATEGSILELVGSQTRRTMLSEQHEVAMSALITGSLAPIGLFRASAGPLQTLGLATGTVPGVSGAKYTDFSQSVINNTGTATFNTIYKQGSDKEAVIQLKGGTGTLIAASQQTAPGTGGAKFDTMEPKDVWSNDNGDTVFVARLNDGREGVFLYSNKQITAIALGGQPAPGAGQNFEAFTSVMINNLKAIVFSATLSDERGGVYLYANGQLTPVALPGQAVPGVNRNFDYFESTAINESGKVVFVGIWEGFLKGIFLYSAGSLQPVVVHGQTIQELQGRRITQLYGMAINGKGEVTFSASLDGAQVPSVILRTSPIQ